MKTILTLPPSVYERVLSEVASVPGRIVECEGAIRRSAPALEVFLPPTALAIEHRPLAFTPARVRVGLWPRFMNRTPWQYWGSFPLPRGHPMPLLEVGLLADGGFCGALIEAGVLWPIDEMRLPGAGMRRWFAAQPPVAPELQVPRDGRFSRLAGALGGVHVLHRLQECAFGIVGVGRSGSLLAHSVARMGVGRLVLVDPDLVEIHNLDAMDGLDETDVGRPKVLAIAAFLSRHFPALDILAFPVGVESGGALEALAACDILISAPDSGHARLMVATVAAVYLRPHLDVGTGVFRGANVATTAAGIGMAGPDERTGAAVMTGSGGVGSLRGARRAEPQAELLGGEAMTAGPGVGIGRRTRLDAGADVRLVLPGEGCLLCVGGIRRPNRARRNADWRTERAGSLRTLNQIGAHLGLHLIERLFSGDLAASSWLQLRTPPAAPFTLASVPIRRDPACPLCARAGHGDLAFGLERSA